VRMWTGSVWLRVVSSGRLSWTWYWTFRFHERWWIYWLAKRLLPSQGGLNSMELVDRYFWKFLVQ
jgi:hypothetical protein